MSFPTEEHIHAAGILIVERYNEEDHLTLFESGYGGIFESLGGKREPGEKVLETAAREGREESANLLYLTPTQLRQHAVPINLKSYRSYAVYVENLDSQDFCHNKQQIHQGCAEDHWKETLQMIRVPLKNLTLGKIGEWVTDAQGEKRKLRSRTQALLNYGLSQVQEVREQKPLSLVRRRAKKSRIPCLVNTISYQL